MASQRDEAAYRREHGFTLIELMVVVLIVAILLSIAVPTYLGMRKRGQDRAAQSDLRNALTVATSYYAGAGWYTADLDELHAIEPNLFKVNGVDATGDPVTVLVVAGPRPQAVCISTRSDSARWFAIFEDATARTRFGNGAADPFSACTAAEAAGFSTSTSIGWG